MSAKRYHTSGLLAAYATMVLLAFLIVLALGCSGRDPSVPGGEAEVGDAVLGLQVRVVLLEGLGTDALKIAVDVRDNVATLSGTVGTPPNDQKAAEIARTVEGVETVENRIEVAPVALAGATPESQPAEYGEQEVADSVLEAKVKKNLLQELGRPALSIDVQAAGGTVSLSGALEDGALCERAVRTAENTQGVESIQDLLEVG